VGTVSLGNLRSKPFPGTAITPFGLFFETGHNQYLYKASELQALGLLAGNITALSF